MFDDIDEDTEWTRDVETREVWKSAVELLVIAVGTFVILGVLVWLVWRMFK